MRYVELPALTVVVSIAAAGGPPLAPLSPGAAATREDGAPTCALEAAFTAAVSRRVVAAATVSRAPAGDARRLAGVGKMSYRGKFLPYDIAGGLLWIGSMSLSGYFLGTIPWVRDHFEAVVIAIIVISVLPMIVAYLRRRPLE